MYVIQNSSHQNVRCWKDHFRSATRSESKSYMIAGGNHTIIQIPLIKSVLLIKGLLAEEYLFISVRNTSYPITFDGENIPTSKVSKEEHGYGLANIKRILSNLNAEYTYEYHDGWFEFVIEIPM